MPNELFTDFLAGCLGGKQAIGVHPIGETVLFYFLGAAGCIAGHPLDTIKIRLQTQRPGTYRGITHCMMTIVRSENLRGLYKGWFASAER